MGSPFDLKNIRIEAATASDLAKLLKLIRAYYRFDRIPFDRKTIASGLSVLINNQTLGRAWLIRDRHLLVGYSILTFGFDLEFGGRQATLTDLYIDTRHRRKGIGRKVLRHLEAFCRTCGVKALELQVTGGNMRALRFYRSVGFEAYERIPMSKRIAC
jgi:ribosomal protein S18 acetylase RimI-like enzyme